MLDFVKITWCDGTMGEDYKKRVQMALENHHRGLIPKAKRKVRNDNPEGRFVLELLAHLRGLGWSIDVVEAKGVYNAEAGRYLHGKTRPGFSDLVGNTPDGLACYIECKAPGKRRTLRPDQREFLTEKIKTGCFAVVVDTIDCFNKLWAQWTMAVDRVGYLLSGLPELSANERRRSDDQLNFDE